MNTNTIVVCDLHGNWQGLLNLLRNAGAISFRTDEYGDGDIPYFAPREHAPKLSDIKKTPNWYIIQLGDAVHMGPKRFPLTHHNDPYLQRYSYRSDIQTLLYVEALCNVYLAGNHELYYSHNLAVGKFSGMAQSPNDMEPGVIPAIIRIMGRSEPLLSTPPYFPLQRLTAATTVIAGGDPWLITHAGLHPHFTSEIVETIYDDLEVTSDTRKSDYIYMAIASKLNRDLLNSARRTAPEDFPWINDVGEASRGPHKIGGIFWLRPSECREQYYNQAKYPQLNQIVGHTPDDKYHPYFDPKRNTWYIDNDSAAGLVSIAGEAWTPIST